MKKRNIVYISIGEERTFYSHLRNGEKLVLKHTACIQERIGNNVKVRTYYGVSEASIFRVAKIQEQLAS